MDDWGSPAITIAIQSFRGDKSVDDYWCGRISHEPVNNRSRLASSTPGHSCSKRRLLDEVVS